MRNFAARGQKIAMLGGALIILFTTFTDDVVARPPCSELKREWNEHYIKDFGLDVGNTMKKDWECKSNEHRLAITLWELRHTKFNINKDNNWFYKYSAARIDKLVFYEPPLKDIVRKVCATGHRNGREVRIYPECYQGNRIPSYALFHEIRHTDPQDEHHVRCRAGKFQGLRDCDEQFYAEFGKGSGYNYGIKYLLLLAYKSTNYEGLTKKEMKEEINYSAENNFNNTPDIEELRKFLNNI